MRKHRQLIFAVAIDEFSISEKIEPVVNRRIERAQEAIATKSAPLEELSSLELSRIAKIIDQQIAHLPAVPHLFAVHPRERLAVVLRGCRIDQVLLLLDGSELGVALIDN